MWGRREGHVTFQLIQSNTIHIQEKLRFHVRAIMFYNHPHCIHSLLTHMELLGSEPPKMTENHKIQLGSVKGDTLVMKLWRPLLAFEWTLCQSKCSHMEYEINSHSLHIRCTKCIRHLARTLWVLKCVWAHIYSFNAFNDAHVPCLNTYVCVCVCVSLCAWR